MELFEYQLVDLGVASWKLAPYMARLMLGLEFFIGALFILNISIKRFTNPLAIALLLFFSVYLIYILLTKGNTGDCGCFGTVLKMPPLVGLLKNIGLIGVALFLQRLYGVDLWPKKIRWLVIPILAIASLLCSFLIYPANAFAHYKFDNDKVGYKLPLDLMYDSVQEFKPIQELRNGKHIIAFLSLQCPHCRVAAKKIKIMQKRNPQFPFYLVLNGTPNDTTIFFEDTETQMLPHHLFLGPDKWMQIAGIQLPIIMYVNNSVVEKKVNGVNLDEADVIKWLNP